MIYINKDDITSIIQERLMNESIALAPDADINDDVIVNGVELKAIDLAESYISGKYDTALIFADVPIRNGVLVQIIASIVVYRCIRRNAARKVPEDYIVLYNNAIKDLEKIQSGAMKLINCPLLTNTDGTQVSPLWGNTTNKDFFI